MTSPRLGQVHRLLLAIAVALLGFGVQPEAASADEGRVGSNDVRVRRHTNYDKLRADREREREKARDAYYDEEEKEREFWRELRDEEETDQVRRARSGSRAGACVFGVNGEVLHAPDGADCGRAPGPRVPQNVPSAAAAQPAKPAAPASAAAQPAPQRKPKSRCIYGADGSLLMGDAASCR